MRTLAVIAPSLLVGSVLSSPAPFVEKELGKRQGLLGGLVSTFVNSGYGRVPDVPNAAPKVQEMEPRSQVPGSKTVKIRYGPYKVANKNVRNFMGGGGVLYNYPDLKVEKPCDECVLLSLTPGLEYPDGKNANVDTGMWLHHMVLMNQGPGRMDPTCVGKVSLPHMVVGSDPGNSERIFASGNERTMVAFNSPYMAPNETLGYYLNPADKFAFIVDLMNQNAEDKTVYLTITYDYVDGHPEGVGNLKSIWFDAAQCGTSEIRPPTSSGQFTVTADWIANLEGEILGAGGHLHDGGTHLTLSVDGDLVCDSVATYGVGGKGGMGGMSGMSGGGMGAGGGMSGMGAGEEGHSHEEEEGAETEHIVRMSGCPGPSMGSGRLEKGQKWSLKGYYDFAAHPPMGHGGGQLEPVMGIAMMFVKNPKV